jgi:hypothetical protein
MTMAKPKKEFKARVRKMKKHVIALIDLSPDEAQRTTLYDLQNAIDGLEEGIEKAFDPVPEALETAQIARLS